jgi:signal transduction histidine kinase
VGQLARDAVFSFGILAEERNQRVTVDAAEGVIVTADRLVLREAVTNVVDNAIKYSPPASAIRVRVYVDGAHAHVTVTDEGPGSPRGIGSGFSIGSFGSMRAVRGTAAARGSGWPSRNGRSR